MTDAEWIRNIKKTSNKELFEMLEYCGCDNYYRDLWEATIEELKRRLKRRRKQNFSRKKVQSEDRQA